MHSIQEGSHSFTEIKKAIGDANTKILTDRLAELWQQNIIAKTESGKYILTERGDILTQKVIEMAKWWAEENDHFSDIEA